MSTYATLISDVQSWLTNTEAEFVAAIPTFIRMAEARLFRDIDVQALETTQAGTLSSGVATLAKPADLIAPRHMTITVAGARKVLRFKELEYLFEYWPTAAATAEPVYYAVDASDYLIAPTPDQVYPYSLGYKRRLPALSATNPSNWLTTDAYDALLYATLCEAVRFLQDDRGALLPSFEERYAAAVAAINAVDQRASRDDYRTPYVPRG